MYDMLDYRNENWTVEDLKYLGGVLKWASKGNKKCLEKIRALNQIALESEFDEFTFSQQQKDKVIYSKCR